MSIEITPFETVLVNQRDISNRVVLAILGATAAMTFTLLVIILA